MIYRKEVNIWLLISSILVLLIIIPSLFIVTGLFSAVNQNWIHIKEYLLQSYIYNSVILVVFTGILSIVIGLSSAWLVTVYDFPFRNFFKWALVLPLSIPPYIGAFTYEGLLNYTGPFQSFFRNTLNINLNPQYLDIMNLYGAVFIYTIFLYPYVYLITRSFLEKQSASLVEISRTLGKSSFNIFINVILPISRGALVGGVSLVILEVLNDYGVVKYFSISTFSTAIFKTWFGLGDLNSSVRLSAILMIFIFLLLGLEKFMRCGRKYSYSNSKVRPISRIKLSKGKSPLVNLYLAAILVIGFIIPVSLLGYWSILSFDNILIADYLGYGLNSIGVALISAILIIISAAIISNTVRISNNILTRYFSRIAIMGYSIPGAVIAVGILIFSLKIDQVIQWLLGNNSLLIVSTGIYMLIAAYIIRFLAIAYNSIDTGFSKVGLQFLEASRTLGKGITYSFFKIDLPMIKPAVISGFLLVLIEILKELPLTLILRPFNFNTLATRAYEYANDEMIHEASLSSLFLIVICVFMVYILQNIGKRGKRDVY
ncbi:MAG: iron ABC transporter permease [Firmicutes bacterium]|nr:iron ABC transporter permease [Bacillota bacterium]